MWCHEHHSYRPHPTLTLSTQWASCEYHSSRSHPHKWDIPQQHPQCIVIISNPEGDGHAKPPLGLTRVGPCEGVTWASLLKLTPAPVEHPAPAPTIHLTTGTPQTRTYNALQWLQLPVRKLPEVQSPAPWLHVGATWVSLLKVTPAAWELSAARLQPWAPDVVDGAQLLADLAQ